MKSKYFFLPKRRSTGTYQLHKKYEQPKDFNWNIHEYENLQKDDIFIVQQVETDNDGIALIGKIKDKCYEDDSWRNDGTQLHYADMWIMDAFDCDNENPLLANRYEQLFPKLTGTADILAL